VRSKVHALMHNTSRSGELHRHLDHFIIF